MSRMVFFTVGMIVSLTVPAAGQDSSPGTAAAQQSGATANYWVYVANESSDLVSRVRFGPEGVVEEKTIPVGIMPADLDGAHGMTVSPDGRFWYVSLAHGTPFGKIWKFTTGEDKLVDTATTGLFPASMAVTPDGSLLFAVNFNLHGNPVPSSVSALFTPVLQEMNKIETCVKPHGSKVNYAGTRHYSVCVGSDQLVEISTERLEVTRRLYLALGQERLVAGDEATGTGGSVSGACKPTWVAVTPDDRTLFVPCNGRNDILEIDAETFQMKRRFETGRGPYNADVSRDGKYLVVSLKGDQAVAIIDVATGEEARVSTTQPITHGVVISPDSRYAFVSNESIGATRGTLDVFDLHVQRLVGSVDLQHQPGGIAFWKMEPATR